MPLAVDITEEPGLHDLLSQGAAPSDARLQEAVDAYLATPGIAGTNVEEGIDSAFRARADATDESLTGMWRAIRRWFAGEQHDVVGTEEQLVELDAYWLTLPAVADAKVSVTSSRAAKGEASASLTIAGIGGGPTLTLALKEDVKFDAAETERVVLTTTGTFELVRVTRNGAVVTTYPRLCALDRANFGWTRRRASPPDPASVGPARSSRTFDASASGGTTTDTLTLTRGTIWEFGAEVGIAKLGLKAKVGGKITYERDVGYTYELPGGHLYVATQYADFPAYLWTVDSP